MYYVDGQLFHVGIRVHDLAAAQAEFSSSFGVEWCAVRDWPMDIWLPDRGYTSMPIALTFSTTGPVRLEIIQGSPGTPLDPDDGPGIHHLGYWVDDPAVETERLLAEGWELVMAAAAPEDGYGRFTYVRSPSGLLIEPVGASNRERFEAWWAGGTLTPPTGR